jgi:hypothetical protein
LQGAASHAVVQKDLQAAAKVLRTKLQKVQQQLVKEGEEKVALESTLEKAKSDLAANLKLVNDLKGKNGAHNAQAAAVVQVADAPTETSNQASMDTSPFRRLPDKTLLSMFAMLSSADVVKVAMCAPHLYKRVDTMFAAETNNDGMRAIASTSRVEGQIAKAERIMKQLPPQEIDRLVAMTNKMKRLHMEKAQLQAAKEDTHARLESAESVRDFLKAKLKETEASIVVKDRELKLAASQTVSDHEVIDFLDNRTQELEREMKKAQEDAAQAKEQVKSGAVGLTAELDQMKQAQAQSAQEAEAVAAEMEKANTERDQALAQVIEMTALLKQAEDQKREAEAQFKSQKKLLVKEVKALRASQRA